ncbi:MAG: UDP-N-acetylmuramoyl-L-alanyl-D-glutamate--2,6-diaminopimelate ligase [Candidatus Eisenbacteria bacterium]
MKLRRLLEGAGLRSGTGIPEVDVTQVAYDSREVGPGGVFVCVSGLHKDGYEFVREAVSRGTVAVVLDRDMPVEGAVRVLVPDARVALASLACQFYGHPSRRLKLVGITGTNGKTTVSYLVKAICTEAGLRVGVLGTIGFKFGDVDLKGSHTTPEAPEFQGLLARMVGEGITHAAVEVSSHALAMRRSYGTEFDAVVFTNLSRDHLDFHGTFEEYKRAKLKLFVDEERGVGEKRKPFAILNQDDPAFSEFAQAARENIVTYGTSEAAQVRATQVEVLPEGSIFHVLWSGEDLQVRLSLSGAFNVTNALAAFAVGVSLGLEAHQVVRGIQSVRGVKGRLERVHKGQSFSVFVDYAHTPDALSNVLKTARPITEGDLICVFGCGGDRDRGKRSQMGRVSGELADYTVITSDNPRSENPLAIIAQIEEGIRGANARYVVIPDRREAIGHALGTAKPADSVLIAGKGHEDYQVLGDRTVHFDDVEVAEEVLLRQVQGDSSGRAPSQKGST